MDESNDNQRTVLGKWALILFVGGLLVPFVIAAFCGGQGVHRHGHPALGFAVAAEILALVFGIIGRKSLYGRIGMIGAICVLGLVPVIGAVSIPLRMAWARHHQATMQWQQPPPTSRPVSAP